MCHQPIGLSQEWREKNWSGCCTHQKDVKGRATQTVKEHEFNRPKVYFQPIHNKSTGKPCSLSSLKATLNIWGNLWHPSCLCEWANCKWCRQLRNCHIKRVKKKMNKSVKAALWHHIQPPLSPEQKRRRWGPRTMRNPTTAKIKGDALLTAHRVIAGSGFTGFLLKHKQHTPTIFVKFKQGEIDPWNVNESPLNLGG